MKTGISGMVKWLALAVFVLAAGCCYSCSLGGEPVGISHAEELQSEPEGGASKASESGSSEASGHGSAKGSEPGSAELSGDSRSGGQSQEEVGTAGDGSTASSPVQTCFVHVCGEVQRPGVYELVEGQRVFEAVELAGGFTADAAESFLNLAEPVRDGMKVQVPDKAMAQDSVAAGLPGGGIYSSGGIVIPGGENADTVHTKININTASKEELMTLRGIGEARAEDIIRYRQQRGGFGSIEDIMKVSGIKDAAFQKIKDDITV